ncbi:MAG: DUF1844 domain-containing protein [Terrimicrobiaceae bacterium]
MPEIQQAPQSGELTQRFIAFVLMHAQQASLFLGQIPHPQTGKAETNLEAAKLFIDQLEMVREKTRGNLSQEESGILTHVLSDLQLAFVKVSSGESPALDTDPAPAPVEEASPSTSEAAAIPGEDVAENRKKFTKSYGS